MQEKKFKQGDLVFFKKMFEGEYYYSGVIVEGPHNNPYALGADTAYIVAIKDRRGKTFEGLISSDRLSLPVEGKGLKGFMRANFYKNEVEK